jgi:hypothetical protein
MFALFAGLPHTRAATTERIVVDRHTGLDDRTRLERFATGPERVIAAAGRKWPDVSHTLSP